MIKRSGKIQAISRNAEGVPVIYGSGLSSLIFSGGSEAQITANINQLAMLAEQSLSAAEEDETAAVKTFRAEKRMNKKKMRKKKKNEKEKAVDISSKDLTEASLPISSMPLSSEQQQALDTIAKIYEARLAYNQVFTEFYTNEDDETIRLHLINLTGGRFSFDKAQIERCRSRSSNAGALDIDFYTRLKNKVQEKNKTPELFEAIFHLLQTKLLETEHGEQRMSDLYEQLKAEDRERFKSYTESKEYLEGREKPHLQDMLKLLEPLLSKNFLAFTEFHIPQRIATSPEGHGMWGYGTSNVGYYKLVEKEFQKLSIPTENLLKEH